MSVLSSQLVIPSKNGYDIHAFFSRPLESEKGCIILCHGTCSDCNEVKNTYVYLTQQLVSAGYAVLRFDFIGSGHSEVDYIHYSYQSAISDTQDVMKYAHELGYDTLGLVGWSQGATIAMLAADETIKSVVCLAGAVDMRILIDDEKYEEAKINGYSWYDPVFREPVKLSIEWYEDVLHTDVLDIYYKKNIPTLAIHGTSDTIVHPKYSKMIVDVASKAFSRVIYMENADHIFNVLSEEYKVFQIVCDEIILWFHETL